MMAPPIIDLVTLIRILPTYTAPELKTGGRIVVRVAKAAGALAVMAAKAAGALAVMAAKAVGDLAVMAATAAGALAVMVMIHALIVLPVENSKDAISLLVVMILRESLAGPRIGTATVVALMMTVAVLMMTVAVLMMIVAVLMMIIAVLMMSRLLASVVLRGRMKSTTGALPIGLEHSDHHLSRPDEKIPAAVMITRAVTTLIAVMITRAVTTLIAVTTLLAGRAVLTLGIVLLPLVTRRLARARSLPLTGDLNDQELGLLNGMVHLSRAVLRAPAEPQALLPPPMMPSNLDCRKHVCHHLIHCSGSSLLPR
jgi:hypothetical protein